MAAVLVGAAVAICPPAPVSASPVRFTPLPRALGPVATLEAVLSVSGESGVGSGVALSGDTALVTSSGTLPYGGAGCAHAFVLADRAWTLQDSFAPMGRESSVALDGDTAIIGGGELARVWVRTGGTWTLQQELTPGPEGRWRDVFGHSVAVSGDTAVVGAPGHGPDVDSDAGAVYVFRRSGSVWNLEDVLALADAGVGDSFGSAVAIEGDTLVAGASGRAVATGAVFVFERSGTTWTRRAMLTASDGRQNAFFGHAVSLSGDRVLVGAPQHSPPLQSGCGKAYIFARSGGIWREAARLAAEPVRQMDFYGREVSLSGDLAVVGAAYRNIGLEGDAGSAFVYRRSGTTWPLQARLGETIAVENGYLGSSVAAAGGTVLVGSPGRATEDDREGQAFVFSISSPARPHVSRISPTEGMRGSVVTIRGAGFGAKRGTRRVSFGARACSDYLSWTETRIRVRVPLRLARGRYDVRVVSGAVSSVPVRFRVIGRL